MFSISALSSSHAPQGVEGVGAGRRGADAGAPADAERPLRAHRARLAREDAKRAEEEKRRGSVSGAWAASHEKLVGLWGQ